MARDRRKLPEGMRRRHSAGCPTAKDEDARCRCKAGYEASVFSARDGTKIRKTFATLDAARTWRADTLSGLRRGTVRAPRPITVRQAGDALIVGMRSGLVRTRSGDPYKPSVTRSYEQALRLRIFGEIGGMKLADVRRTDVQAIADSMLADGSDPSTIRNTFLPLRVIFRRALEDGDLAVNPCNGLRLPAVRGRRERIASPAQAAALLVALANPDRALWATAFYAGLRLGELRALRWGDVDLAKGMIRVERSLDHTGRVVAPKSRAGKRTVPIVAALRDELLALRVKTRDDGYVFGSHGRPFISSTAYDRARRAWTAANAKIEEENAKLQPVGLHEARHTFASILIAAGVNAKAITTYMGHSSITVTYDLYGHLMPGSEDEARALVDAYLERANTQARLAALPDD